MANFVFFADIYYISNYFFYHLFSGTRNGLGLGNEVSDAAIRCNMSPVQHTLYSKLINYNII